MLVNVKSPRPGSRVRSTIQTMISASTTQADAITAETSVLLKQRGGNDGAGVRERRVVLQRQVLPGDGQGPSATAARCGAG